MLWNIQDSTVCMDDVYLISSYLLFNCSKHSNNNKYSKFEIVILFSLGYESNRRSERFFNDDCYTQTFIYWKHMFWQQNMTKVHVFYVKTIVFRNYIFRKNKSLFSSMIVIHRHLFIGNICFGNII